MGLNKDRNKAAVQKHVKVSGLNLVEHYWIKTGGNTTTADDWDVEAVPHFVIVDGKGKIAFIGHPKDIELESAIDQLLDGQ